MQKMFSSYREFTFTGQYFHKQLQNHIWCNTDTYQSTMQTRTSKLVSKYEKQIEELTNQCNMKSDECYMAWSSVESTNQELERLKIELHQKVMQSDNIGMN